LTVKERAMRSRVQPRQEEQLGLFHPPRHRPTWQRLPEEVRERARRLLAQMLREQVARRLGGDAVTEASDE
jgi:hypothetical protein